MQEVTTQIMWGYLGGFVLFLAICYGIYRYVVVPHRERDKGAGPFHKDVPGDKDPK